MIEPVRVPLELDVNQYLRAVRQARVAGQRLADESTRGTRQINDAYERLGVRSTRNMQRELDRLNAAYNRIRRSGTASASDIARAQRALRTRTRELRLETGGYAATLTRLRLATGPLAGALGAAFSVAGVAAFGREVVRSSNEMTRLRGQLNLVTESLDERLAAERALFEIAQDSRTEYSATVDLFARVSRATASLGASQQQVLTVTQAVNRAIQLSGAGAQEAAAGALQLGQALASGRLQGDELRSLLENMPRLATAIADELGVGVGALRDMGSAGELTSRVVFDALLNQAGRLGEEFQRLPVSIEGAAVQLRNQLQQALGAADAGPLVAQIQELTRVLGDPAIARALTDISTGLVSIGSSALSSLPDAIEYVRDFANLVRSAGAFAGAYATSVRDFFQASSIEDLNARRERNEQQLADTLREIALGTYDAQDQAAGDSADNQIAAGERALQAAEQQRQQSVAGAQAAARQVAAAEREAADERVQAEADAQARIAELREQAAGGFGAGAGRGGDEGIDSVTDAYDGLSRVMGDVDAARAAGDAEALAAAQARAAAIAEETRALGEQADTRDVLARLEEQYRRAATEGADLLASELERTREQAAEPAVFELDVSGAVENIDKVLAQFDRLAQRASKPIRLTLDAPGAAPARPAPGFSRGTVLRGYGGGDRLAALLEAGEAVIPKESVAGNRALIEQLIRQRGRLPGFNLGAIIGAPLPATQAPGAALQPVNVSVPGSGVFALSGAPGEVDGFARAIDRLALKHGTGVPAR